MAKHVAGAAAVDVAADRMTTKEARVVFTPSGKRGSFPLGMPVLDAARSLGVDVDSVCGGRGLCGRCQVSPSVGEFAKWAINSTEDAVAALLKMDDTRLSDEELDRLQQLIDDRRSKGDTA